MIAKDALHTYYKKNDLSQPEIAVMLEVSQATIHNWISGKNKIPMECYARIAIVCEIDLIDLLPDDWKILLNNERSLQRIRSVAI